jgi:RNA polymerase sigma-70 factor (ECF subfamily)
MSAPRRAGFDTTHWSLILAARDDSSDARQALATLCEAYWYPLYAYIRRQGHDADAARDLTQSFFLSILERQDLRQVSPERGRFRSFLLAAVRHFLLNDAVRRGRLKRGGGQTAISLDLEDAESRYRHEPVDRDTPETLFNRRWALTAVQRALHGVRDSYRQRGKGHEFDVLLPSLLGDLPHGGVEHLAEALDMKAGAVRMAMSRLRQAFRHRLREEVAGTVLAAETIDGEIRYLKRLLRS